MGAGKTTLAHCLCGKRLPKVLVLGTLAMVLLLVARQLAKRWEID